MPHDARPEGGKGTVRKPVALGGGEFVPYPDPTNPAATRIGKANPRSGTRPETRLRSALHRAGVRFRKDHPLRVDGGRVIRPDIVFPGAKIAVFVDGCFWHACPQHGTKPKANTGYWVPKLARNVARDQENDRRLESAGWQVVRVWEHTSLDVAVNDVLQALQRAAT